MKSLGDYLHGKGLKFGLYEVPVDKTCAQYSGSYPGATGSQGHEAQDARQFAAWGVDYLKYDCSSPNGTITDQVPTFAKMRDALAATGRPIVFSINPNSFHAKTGPQRNWGDVANMWRTTEDITNAWDTGQTNGYPMGVRNIVNVTVPLAGYARPGAFNDPDMMEVGRGGMTDTEMRSHFALWTMLAAPLIAGNDIRSMTSATQTILKNPDLIAIDQDSLGLQATQISNDGTRRVLAKRLADGDVAVALFNQGSGATTISTTAAAIGKSGTSFTLRDAWTGATSTSGGAISASVPGHGTAVYRVSGGGTSSDTTTTLVSAASGRCLDVPDGNTANGTQPVIWDCNGGANQRWTLAGAALQALGKCLDAPTNATAGAKAQLWDCNGGSNQQWTLNADGTIRGAQSGLCLDVDHNLTANGTVVLLWTCTASANQRWSRV
jgi:alpha-galactosidase